MLKNHRPVGTGLLKDILEDTEVIADIEICCAEVNDAVLSKIYGLLALYNLINLIYSDVVDVQSTVNDIEADVAVVDGIVDDILEDTIDIQSTVNDIEGDVSTVDGIVDNILEDTGSTLPTQIAALVTDYLNNGTHGLPALETLVDSLESVLGALDDAAASGVPTNTDTGMAYLKQLVNHARDIIFHGRGLSAYGVVTAVNSATEFESLGLDSPHHLSDYFNGWWLYVLEADQAAPLHEWRQVSDFVQSDGCVTHAAFSVQLDVGDQILMVNPVLYEVFLITAALSSHESSQSTHRTALTNHESAQSTHRTALGNHESSQSTHRTALGNHNTALTNHESAQSTHRGNWTPTRAGYIDELAAANLPTDITNIKSVADAIAALTDTKVMGRTQVKVEAIDLNGNGAGSYALVTAVDGDVVIEALVFRTVRDLSGDSGFSAMSFETDDATVKELISSTTGAKANLTAESQISWTGSHVLKEGTYIYQTIYDGAINSEESLCEVIITFRSIVSGAYIA